MGQIKLFSISNWTEGGPRGDLPVYKNQDKYQYFIRKYQNPSTDSFRTCRDFVFTS